MLFNFFRAFLLSMLSISMLNAKIPLLSDRLSDKVESISEKIGDLFILETWGQLSLSQENEALVRSVIDEVGLNSKVIIKKFSDESLCAGMSKNACTLDFGTIIYIYFDEEYFNTLTQEEKKFLIAHEASHAKRFHVALKVIMATAIFPLVKLANKKLCNGWLDTETLPMRYTFKNEIFPELSTFGPVKLPLSFIVSMFLFSKASKFAEFDADLSAVRSLGVIDGGVNLFERQLSESCYESRFRIKRIYNRLVFQIRDFFTSHPTHEQRIDVLKKFEEDQHASLSKILIRHCYDMIKKGCNNFSTNIKVAIS